MKCIQEHHQKGQPHVSLDVKRDRDDEQRKVREPVEVVFKVEVMDAHNPENAAQRDGNAVGFR